MALSKTLTEYFIQEFKRSPEYRQEHLTGCTCAALNGELEVTRELIKYAVHSSMGFVSLGKKLGKSQNRCTAALVLGATPLQKR